MTGCPVEMTNAYNLVIFVDCVFFFQFQNILLINTCVYVIQ